MHRPARRYNYLTDSAEIYRRSFAQIRGEADLRAFNEDQATVAVRMIHAAGAVDLAADIEFHPRLVSAAREALVAGAAIFTDAGMIERGITRTRLPASNEVRCLLRDERVTQVAAELGTTRSAAAVSLWGDAVDGAVVAIGNAPTALFHLLELIGDGGPRPAAIVGVPVGFVGSAESKVALAENPWDIPFVVVHGNRGGSAIASAAINALARAAEL